MDPIASLAASARQSAALGETAHRPWPVPAKPWRLGQTWEDLLFLHWRVNAADLRRLLPDSLELELYDGSAWLGILPFRSTALRLRGTLPLPGISSFLELNVRTYATFGGKPGVWFFSLDASSRLAVEVARRAYGLPYFAARMSAQRRDEWIEYESARVEAAEHPVVFSCRYRPRRPVVPAASGSLEEFLTERYCLYAADRRGRLCRAEIHHLLWPIQEAEAELELNTMAPRGVALPDEPPLAHYAAEVAAVIWPLERVNAR